jgi:hypothetical protein
MIFCGEVDEGVALLEEILEKLRTVAEGKLRLWYQFGTISITVIAWSVYLFVHQIGSMPKGWDPWMLSATLAMAGGMFSVCLNIGSLPVTVNQQLMFLLFAGMTRSVVALLAGIGLLLAMRAKIVVPFVYGGVYPDAASILQNAEMFFCFLAGFSEAFVPNILKTSEKTNAAGTASAGQRQTPPDDPI